MADVTASTEPTPVGRSRQERYPTGPWTAAAVGACGCVAVALIDPTEHAMSPPCPFRALTGWWCPFCGATRSASRLVRGDVASALRFNLLFVVLLPLAGLLWAGWAFPGRFAWLDPIRARATPIVTALFALAVAFVVVRNTPWGLDWLRYPGA